MAAVAQHDEARLLALEELLDDDARPRGTHTVVDEHHVHRGVSLARLHRDHYPLARSKPVRLYYDGRPVALDVSVCRGGIGKGGIGRGRDAMARHEGLREILRAFELRRAAPRAEDPQALFLKAIHDAFREGVFRPDDRKPDVLPTGEIDEFRDRCGGDVSMPSSFAVPALPGATNTRVTRGDWARRHARACSRPPPPTTRTFM